MPFICWGGKRGGGGCRMYSRPCTSTLYCQSELDRCGRLTLARNAGVTLPVRLTLISTSWDQVGAEAWANYLQTVSWRVGLGFVAADGSAGNGSDADFHRLQQRQQQEGSATIIALADPGPGMSADKGAAIGASLDDWNISGSTALLIDDSDGNIHSAAKVCDTLWLPERAGMSIDAVNYVMARLDHRVGGGTEGGGHVGVAPVLLIGLLSLCLLAMVAALCTMRWRPSRQSLQYQHLRQQEANPAKSQTIK